MFWEATPESGKIFVADPSQGSRHNRGAAVDLTIYDRRTGRPIEMVSGYDEFSARAFPDYPGGTSRQRYDRELLRRAMEAEGFRVYDHPDAVRPVCRDEAARDGLNGDDVRRRTVRWYRPRDFATLMVQVAFQVGRDVHDPHATVLRGDV